MKMIDLIEKKRDGFALSKNEIEWFITNYTQGDIPDYQTSALLMAILLKGMDDSETTHLTLAMAESGEMLDLSDITSYAIDKHSSGGVGDKTSLVVLPLVASCGVTVAKMSGRGLGYTGGTIDKFESIAGFRVDLSEDDFRKNAREIGIVLTGQSKDLAPADGKLYALRDVTATVPALPLIVSSIMSKKIASGSQGIVLDVKVGTGAFMSTVEAGQELAEKMVTIGTKAGRDVIACVSDMNQPLGCAVGNALEVKEAIDTLHGHGPKDLHDHCIEIAWNMLRLSGQGEKWTDKQETVELLEAQLNNNQAYNKFRELIAMQGGDVSMIDNPEKLPQAPIQHTFTAEQNGYISQVHALEIAKIAFDLGAGRERKEDELDLSVGVVVHCNVGDEIKKGDALLTCHANSEAHLKQCEAHLSKAITISNETIEPLPLFYDTIVGGSVK